MKTKNTLVLLIIWLTALFHFLSTNIVIGQDNDKDSLPIPDTCNYALLDFNCDCIPDTVNGSVITYWIRYFKGLGPDTLPCYCWDNYHNRWLYSPGDVNGSCRFSGADILYMIAYFSGRVDEILWCPHTPPGCD